MAQDKPRITITSGETKTPVQPKLKITTTSGHVQQHHNKADVVFVFDTTGSMDSKIAGLLKTCTAFVDESKSLDLDTHFALISFGDVSVQGGGDRIDLVVPLTANMQDIKTGLRTIPRNNGFGNQGETPFEAIRQAFTLPYRKDAVKVLILITDEPALQHNISASTIMSELRQLEYLVFVLATGAPYYKEMAKQNGGVWKEISQKTDLAEVLELFRALAQRVSQVAKKVHSLGDGSVKKYLALKSPED